MGRTIRLPESTWTGHIRPDHPEVPDPAVVAVGVTTPDFIVRETRKTTVASTYYCRGAIGGKFKNMLLAVPVEWEGDGRKRDTGCVKTAYVCPQPFDRGEPEWLRPSRPR